MSKFRGTSKSSSPSKGNARSSNSKAIKNCSNKYSDSVSETKSYD